MNRVALVIGVGEYCNFHSLPRAILDAKSFYGIVVDESLGAYSANASRLLISPSMDELRSSLSVALFECAPVEVFTMFFAGHGCWHKGSYFILARDSRADRLSVTALPILYLFSLLTDAQPRQTNVIIDACNAGGMVGDLGALLKPDSFGDASTPGVTLFASAMRDQSAGEDAGGGFATRQIVSITRGRKFINQHLPYLDS